MSVVLGFDQSGQAGGAGVESWRRAVAAKVLIIKRARRRLGAMA